jgi:periplasmic divalent cation tolerance protein
MTGAIVVLCTCSSREEGMRIAQALVEERLAACVNVLPGVASVYRWQGQVETAEEVLLVMKTAEQRFPQLCERIAALHSYEVPEIISLAVRAGAEKYLAWLHGQL